MKQTKGFKVGDLIKGVTQDQLRQLDKGSLPPPTRKHRELKEWWYSLHPRDK